MNNDEIIYQLKELIAQKNKLINLELSEKDTKLININNKIQELKNTLSNKGIETSQINNDMKFNNNKILFG